MWGGILKKKPVICMENLERLAAGIYTCPENHMHVFAEELLEANGYQATLENIATLESAFAGCDLDTEWLIDEKTFKILQEIVTLMAERIEVYEEHNEDSLRQAISSLVDHIKNR